MKFVNQFFLILISALIIFTPFYSLKRVFIMLACFFIWYVTSCNIDKRFLRKSLPYIGLISLWAILSGFLHNQAVTNAGSTYFTRFMAFSLWTYIWCVFYIFYSDNFSLFKESLKYLIIFIVISCALTIRGNIIYPDASRLLAGLSEKDTSLGVTLRSLYVGGYDFIYGIVYLLMPTVLYLRYTKEKKIYLWIFLALEAGVVLLGDFFTGFLLAVAMAIFACVKVENNSKTLFVVSLLVLLVFISKDLILEAVIGVGNSMGLESLSHRATQMLLGTYQSDYDMKMNDLSRTERAVNALRNIMDSPLLGQLVERGGRIREAGHSEFLTYFEKFGFIAITYVLFFKNFYKKCLHHIRSRVFKKYFIIYAWFVIAFLFLDTFDVANATGFVVFFFAPLLFQYVDMKSDPFFCKAIKL